MYPVLHGEDDHQQGVLTYGPQVHGTSPYGINPYGISPYGMQQEQLRSQHPTMQPGNNIDNAYDFASFARAQLDTEPATSAGGPTRRTIPRCPTRSGSAASLPQNGQVFPVVNQVPVTNQAIFPANEGPSAMLLEEDQYSYSQPTFRYILEPHPSVHNGHALTQTSTAVSPTDFLETQLRRVDNIGQS